MADKAAVVAELSEKFKSSNTVLLTEYRGLTVSELKEFRRSIGDHASYAVAKNTLLSIAAKDAGVDQFNGEFVGPSAMVFVHGDPVAVAKSVKEFAKAQPLLVVRSGIMDGARLEAKDIEKLADLESREVLWRRPQVPSRLLYSRPHQHSTHRSRSQQDCLARWHKRSPKTKFLKEKQKWQR